MHNDPPSAISDQPSDLGPRTSAKSRPRVLAISSTGGHWIQMLRLKPAFEGCDITFSTTNADYRTDVTEFRFRKIIDANRTQKLKAIFSLLSVAWVVITEWPNIILTTGAAPGFFALRLGKLFGKKTIWLDSIANADELSMSGQKAGKHADLWLTQWEHLAKPEGPHYYGNVLGDSSEVGAQSSETGEQKAVVSDQDSDLRSQNSEDKRSTVSDQQSAISNPTGDLRPQTSDLHSQSSEQKSFRIFVTVGSDVPFDRMVKVINEWAGSCPEAEVFAQIGNSNHEFRNIDTCPFLSPSEFTAKLESATLVIAHAGMGSILSALKHEKPILVMPRFGYLGETRNEHQVATVERLAPMGLIEVAKDERALADRLAALEVLTSTGNIAPWASKGLRVAINRFILQEKARTNSDYQLVNQ